MSYDQTWMDQNSSWWAKANRAKEHIDSLRCQVDEFRASVPYSLTPELTEKPGRLAYRLRFSKQVPVAISTTVGDVLHNLRAALESLAFEVARRGQGGTLTASQEKASTFPIRETPEALDAFFAGQGRKGLLYDHGARAALRSVQPFVNLEEAHKLGVALDKGFEEDFRWSVLHRLDTLWNIDKHRRLALMAWWPDLIYWTSDGPSNRRAFPGGLPPTGEPPTMLSVCWSVGTGTSSVWWSSRGCSRSCHRPPCRLMASSPWPDARSRLIRRLIAVVRQR